jgi:transposase InsO family protein
MSAVDCADAFIAALVSRFGVPSNLTSGRGARITAAVWSALCLKLGISHQMTTAYHPQSNGMVERAYRQLKDALRSCLAGVQWPQHLPWALLGLRAAPKKIRAFLLLSWPMGPLSLYLASSSLRGSCLQLVLWRDCIPRRRPCRRGSPPMRRWQPGCRLPSWRQNLFMSGAAVWCRPRSRSTWTIPGSG